MKETIKTISIVVIASVLLFSIGGYVVYKYITLENAVSQVVNFINQSIAVNQSKQVK